MKHYIYQPFYNTLSFYLVAYLAKHKDVDRGVGSSRYTAFDQHGKKARVL